MKKKLMVLSGFVLGLAPAAAFAQADIGPCGAGLANILCRLGQLLGYVVPVLVALGVVYFVWGIVQYVIGDSEEAKKKGRDRIIFGVIGLAVIISVWGLVYIVTTTFFGGNVGSAPTPGDLQHLLPQ